jgi:hypothetical protein
MQRAPDEEEQAVVFRDEDAPDFQSILFAKFDLVQKKRP